MRLCGICKTLYPDIDERSDDICLKCKAQEDDYGVDPQGDA